MNGVRERNWSERPPRNLNFRPIAELVAEFLETVGLYTSVSITFGEPRPAQLAPPDKLLMHCRTCARRGPTTTWIRVPDNDPLFQYRCSHCERETVRYWLSATFFDSKGFAEPVDQIAKFIKAKQPRVELFGAVSLTKFGQWPEPAIAPPTAVAKVLAKSDLEIYRRGLICLKHGYGIGGFAYFRRLLENVVDVLLGLLDDAAKLNGKEEMRAAVAKARTERSAESKLRLIVEILPEGLKPGGMNPIRQLYGAFSVAIHELPEDECIALAVRTKNAFDTVITNLSTRIAAGRKMASDLNSPLNKGKS